LPVIADPWAAHEMENLCLYFAQLLPVIAYPCAAHEMENLCLYFAQPFVAEPLVFSPKALSMM
jgi:hypothetical protein